MTARSWRAAVVALVGGAACAVRAPAPIDVGQLLAARGPIEARRDLEIRVTGDPRDVAGRLALAELDEQIGRPSEALDALEAVEALGGPLGVRWRAGDRARLARLVAARGRARLERGAASALADLERARQLGAAIGDGELDAARTARAVVALRHGDRETRDGGRGVLAALAAAPRAAMSRPSDAETAHDAWQGARPGASPEQRGVFGAWLWQHGARRAAWDELSAWHGATRARTPALQEAYLVAARWWLPYDRPPSTTDVRELTEPSRLGEPWRCAFVVCAPREVVGDERLERAYLLAPIPPLVRDPADAAALAGITLRQALRGEVAWGAVLAARVDLVAFGDAERLAALPRYVQPMFARLTGQPIPAAGDAASPDQQLIVAAERALAGASAAEVAALGGSSPYRDALLRVVARPTPVADAPAAPAASTGDAFAAAAARHASLVAPASARPDELRAIVAAYRRDPVIADRLGRDAVAAAIDAAAMHATLGALFDALGDPARARVAWQAAVDASPEAAFLTGLAEAEARQGDGDAALVAATNAAAASGDPAVVWTGVAAALAGSGRYVHALAAARSAIDLSGPETLAAALEVASAASRALGRDAQAMALDARRARVPPGRAAGSDRDPTDVHAALAAYRPDPGAADSAAAPRDAAAALARLWIASRWNPRDVASRAALIAALPAADGRRTAVQAELVDLAGDRDPTVRRAAVAALR